eukprot:20569-Heterococcus_DN1.PRE.1
MLLLAPASAASGTAMGQGVNSNDSTTYLQTLYVATVVGNFCTCCSLALSKGCTVAAAVSAAATNIVADDASGGVLSLVASSSMLCICIYQTAYGHM